MSAAITLTALAAGLPQRALAAAAAAMLATAPFSTLDEDDARRFHGAVHAAGFHDAAPGRLYEHIGVEGASQGGYPVCGYVSGDAAAPAVSDRTFSRYYNRLGQLLPVETVLGWVFGDGPHAMTSLTLATQVTRLDTASRPGPAESCEAMAHEAQRRGNVVCVVDSVVMRDGQPWAIRFNPYAFMAADAAAPVACPLAESNGLMWRIKGPLVTAS